MRNYNLSDDAEEDLRNIALYTLDMWGQVARNSCITAWFTAYSNH